MGCCKHKKRAPKPGAGDYCMNCALKHMAKARAIWLESQNGYPLDRWKAMGHISEAEDHLVAKHRALAASIRRHRLNMEDDQRYAVPFNKILQQLIDTDELDRKGEE